MEATTEHATDTCHWSGITSQHWFVIISWFSKRDMPLVPNVIGPPVKTLAELPLKLSRCPMNAAWRICLPVSRCLCDTSMGVCDGIFHRDGCQHRRTTDDARAVHTAPCPTAGELIHQQLAAGALDSIV